MRCWRRRHLKQPGVLCDLAGAGHEPGHAVEPSLAAVELVAVGPNPAGQWLHQIRCEFVCRYRIV